MRIKLLGEIMLENITRLHLKALKQEENGAIITDLISHIIAEVELLVEAQSPQVKLQKDGAFTVEFDLLSQELHDEVKEMFSKVLDENIKFSERFVYSQKEMGSLIKLTKKALEYHGFTSVQLNVDYINSLFHVELTF